MPKKWAEMVKSSSRLDVLVCNSVRRRRCDVDEGGGGFARYSPPPPPNRFRTLGARDWTPVSSISTSFWPFRLIFSAFFPIIGCGLPVNWGDLLAEAWTVPNRVSGPRVFRNWASAKLFIGDFREATAKILPAKQTEKFRQVFSTA